MNVNFAVTSPPEWVSNALNSRNVSIISPGRGSTWATQRIPWARLISSANIGSGEGSNLYRINNVLWVGNYEAAGAGYSNLSSFNNSYDPYNFRPRPGLESLNVSFKGTMGSTRACTVSFKCWNLEDLQILEQIYMVPGISLIAEWGWSLTADGDLCYPNDNFLNLSPQRDPYSDIMKQVLDRRQSTQGSYDGLVGLISNFNYKLNEQLGFDCEVELIAPGEMWLEQNATNTSKGCTTNDNDEQKMHSNLEFIFHDLYRKNKTEEKCKETNEVEKDTVCVMQEWETETREYDKQQRSSISSEAIGEFFNSMVGNSALTHQEVYISWAYFVKLLNDNINLFVPSEDPSATAAHRHDTPPDIHLALDLIPVTILPKFFSLDPTICTFKPVVDVLAGKDRERAIATADEIEVQTEQVTNEQGQVETRTTEVEPGFWSNLGQSIVDAWQAVTVSVNDAVNLAFENDTEIRKSYPDLLPPLTDLEFAKKQILNTNLSYNKDIVSLNTDNANFVLANNVGLLNNIFLNTGYLRDVVAEVAGDGMTIQEYLTKILGDLNIATGNLWNLQWYIPEDEGGTVHVYDANYTGPQAMNNQIIPYKFSLLGDNKTILIRNAEVESKLVDGFKNLVLYGNNADDNGNNDTANQGMKLYADKITDGWRLPKPEEKQQHPKHCIDSKGKIKRSTLEPDPGADLDLAYVLLLRAADPETVTSAKNAMQSYVNWINTDPANKEVAKSLPRNNNILLPFNFSITLDGFSGFVWGNAIEFDYLPSRYGDRIYFQITKISHKLDSSDWTTTIETIMRLKASKEDSAAPPTPPGPKPAGGASNSSNNTIGNSTSDIQSSDTNTLSGDTSDKADTYSAVSNQSPSNAGVQYTDPDSNRMTGEFNRVTKTESYSTVQYGESTDLEDSKKFAKQNAANDIRGQIQTAYGNDTTISVVMRPNFEETYFTEQLSSGIYRTTYSTTRTFDISYNQ